MKLGTRRIRLMEITIRRNTLPIFIRAGLKHREPSEIASRHLKTPYAVVPVVPFASGATQALAVPHGAGGAGLAARLADIRQNGLRQPAAKLAWYLADTTLQATGRGASMLAIGTGINAAHLAVTQAAHFALTGHFQSFASVPNLIANHEVADKALKYAGLALAMEWGGDEVLHLVKKKVSRSLLRKPADRRTKLVAESHVPAVSALTGATHILTLHHPAHDGGWLRETIASVRKGDLKRPAARLGHHFGKQLGHALFIGGATAGAGELYNGAHLLLSGEKAFTQAGIFGFHVRIVRR